MCDGLKGLPDAVDAVWGKTIAAGRHAGLAVITGLLHAATEGTRTELTGVLRQRAAEILQSPAASTPARARARHRQESG